MYDTKKQQLTTNINGMTKTTTTEWYIVQQTQKEPATIHYNQKQDDK